MNLVNKKFWNSFFEKIAMAVLLTLFFVSLLSLKSETVWLNTLSPLTIGLSQVAVVKETRGRVQRKTVIDSLWLPLAAKQSVYVADALLTGAHALANLHLSEGLSIRVLPETFIRLRTFQGLPLIRLAKGRVYLQSDHQQKIYFKQGSEIREHHLEQGTYMVAINQGPGIQITEHVPEMDFHSEEEDSQERVSEFQSDDFADRRVGAPRKALVAFPVDQTLILLGQQSSVDTLAVGVNQPCPKHCQIKLYFNEHILVNESFSADEDVYLMIPRQQLEYGRYFWQYIKNERTYSYEFFVEAVSEEAFHKALKNNWPIEILD